jgi:hypothetical protein
VRIRYLAALGRRVLAALYVVICDFTRASAADVRRRTSIRVLAAGSAMA